MTSEQQPQIRYRLNVSDSTKGVRTTDSTLEWSGNPQDMTAEEFVALRQVFQAEVDKAYPPPTLAP